MSTLQKKVFIGFIVLAVVLAFTGCPNPTAPAATYTVTYDGNGATSGTVPVAQTKTKEVDLTLAANSGNLQKTGYTFGGWNMQADGAGTDYAEGASYTTDADVTLYAKWTVDPGAQQTFTASGVSFNMVIVPSYSDFPTGTDE